jgi:hypothetical protein
MGLSFSSSLFGLAGSLILGFLDLKAAQAQNRFYTDLEDWLSTMTDIAAGDFQQQGSQPSLAPQLLRADVQALQRAIEKLSADLEISKSSPGATIRGRYGFDRAAGGCGRKPRDADARGTENGAAMGARPADAAE